MPKKTSLWSPEEGNALAQLINYHTGCDQKVPWTKISQILNQKFHKSKNSKQCREYYAGNLKLNRQNNLIWNESDRKMLYDIYFHHGSKWKLISSQFKDKSQNNIKNYFHNAVRRMASKMNKIQQKLLKKSNNRTTYCHLNNLIDLSNELLRRLLEKGLTINNESMIFRFRKELLSLCFLKEHHTQDDMIMLSQLKSKINCFVRSSSAFRENRLRKLEIRDSLILMMNKKDRICQEDITLYFGQNIDEIEQDEDKVKIEESKQSSQNYGLKCQDQLDYIEYNQKLDIKIQRNDIEVKEQCHQWTATEQRQTKPQQIKKQYIMYENMNYNHQNNFMPFMSAHPEIKLEAPIIENCPYFYIPLEYVNANLTEVSEDVKLE